MNQSIDPIDPGFTAALRRELVALPSARPRHARRFAAITAGVVGALAFGGVAVAGLLPAGEVASPPLAPPVILNGVGPAKVVLPDAPGNATYVNVTLTCYDGRRCGLPSGVSFVMDGVPDDGMPKVTGGALPLTDAFDPHNAQRIPPVNPAVGVAIDVSRGTHWRVYAVYTDSIDPKSAPVGNGKILGVPNLTTVDLVPAVATNGKPGWVDYSALTWESRNLTWNGVPQLTPQGTSQAPIPVYGADGTTVIGKADVSAPYRR
jgi:hypothetical protein